MRALAFACSVALVATPAGAQTPTPACQVQGSYQWLATRPSPLDSATLRIGDRIAKICYSRPSARGRSVDSLVPLRVAWRTGANEPTTLTLTGTLSVAGAVLPAGRYVILTVPQADQWVVVLHTTTETEPAKMFGTLVEAGKGMAPVERPDTPIEQFTIRAEAGSAHPAFLMEWGMRRVRVPVESVP